jgi:hypothetical protein
MECKLAYNRGDYLEERARLLFDWSAYFDSVSNVVVPINVRG